MSVKKLIAVIALFSMLTALSIAVGFNKVRDVIRDQKPTNISEYLTSQDQKIEYLRKSMTEKDLKIDELEKQRSMEIETWQLMAEDMTEVERKKFWDKWSVTICPHYEADWYCEGEE